MVWRAGIVLGVVLTCLMPAAAQLTADDIQALRERGEREGWTFTVRENPATAYPIEKLCGVKIPPNWREGARFDLCEPTRTLPAAFDWRNVDGQNYVTPVRDQGGCGSCWAFSVVGAFEGNIFIKDLTSEDLAEQWLVSCCNLGGCGGEWPGTAIQYYVCGDQWHDPWGDSGAVPEVEFPYVAWDAPCNTGPYSHPWCLDGWAFIGPEWGIPSVDQLKQAIYDHGPISVCVYASSPFMGYGGGIFNACENTDINHAVVLVGWNDAGGYWIMKNSWGEGWGEDGYMRITYNCNRIGYHGLYVDYPGHSGLRVAPAGGLDSTGSPGGPFTPNSVTYTVKNIGTYAVDYQVASTQSWLSFASPTGTLAGGAEVPVTVSIGSAANALPMGDYADTVTFTNLTDHVGDTTRPVTLFVGRLRKTHEWTLDTDPGWYNQYRWDWGHPNGSSGDHGGPDPIGGRTGANCFGYNLYGGYTNNLLEWHLSTRAVDCTGITHVWLRFWRWLGIQSGDFDRASVRVSSDQIHWTTVWENPDDVAIDDQAWVQQECNLAAVADNQPHVYIRWTMGPTDSEWTMCGWNIDDIEIWGAQPTQAHPGDLNCDNLVDFEDISPFVLAMSDPGAYNAAYPDCNLLNGDCDGDGTVSFDDIIPFVALLSQ